MTFPFRNLPYSIGVNEIIKLVPSLPAGSSSPDFGITVNSGSESGVKKALNYWWSLYLFSSLKETLEVLFNAEWIVIMSSSSGSVASKYILNL